MIRMSDVAKEAGVSIATVSRVVAGGQAVSPHTHSKVLQAIKRLGYELNFTARNLSTMQKENIGLVIPNRGFFEPGFGMLVNVMMKLSDMYKKKLIIKEAEPSPEGEYQVLTSLNQYGCDLIVFLPLYSSSAEAERFISMISSPVIVIDRRVNNAASIWTDYFNTMYQTTDLLIRYGHKQIFYVGNLDRYSDRKFLQGYRASLKHHNISFVNRRVINTGSDYEEAKRFVIKAVEENNDYTAIVASDMNSYFSLVRHFSNPESLRVKPELFCVTRTKELALKDTEVNTVEIPTDKIYQNIILAAQRILDGYLLHKSYCIKSKISIRNRFDNDINNKAMEY